MRRREGLFYLVPVLFFLALGAFWPLYRVLERGLGKSALAVVQDPYLVGRFLWSLGWAAGTSLLVIGLGLPLAYLLRQAFPGRRLFIALLTVPFVMPVLVVAVGFLALVGPRGLLGVNLVHTALVLFWAAVFYNLGLAARVLEGLLAGGEALEAAARTLGAGPWRTFFRVTLPLLKPGLFSAAGLAFIYTFASLGLPLILGGPRFATLEVVIYERLAYRLDFATASALVLWQAAVLMGVTFFYLRAGGQGLISARSPRPAASPRVQLLLGGVAWGFLFLFLAPLWALVLESVKTPEGFGLAYYARLFADGGSYFVPGAGLAIHNTLRFALAALALAAPVGLFYALGVHRGARGLDLLGMVPLFLSPVSLGVGYLLAYPFWRASAFLLVLAYATMGFPVFARALIPALRALRPSWLEAAATLGAGPLRRLLRLELPLVRPALFAGASLALASAIGEFGATLLLVRPEWATLSIAIYERLGRPGVYNYGEALALSVLLMVVSGALFFLFGARAEGA